MFPIIKMLKMLPTEVEILLRTNVVASNSIVSAQLLVDPVPWRGICFIPTPSVQRQQIELLPCKSAPLIPLLGWWGWCANLWDRERWEWYMCMVFLVFYCPVSSDSISIKVSYVCRLGFLLLHVFPDSSGKTPGDWSLDDIMSWLVWAQRP